MFGGLVGSNQVQGADWGETLLNKVATNTLRHLFTRSEEVNVDVRCHPSSKLLQGTIDSFKMHGRGLVIRQDFRTEEMSFETDAVSLDFSAVLKGKIDLKQITQAIAQVHLTQDDINGAFKAQLVRQHLEDLDDPRLLEVSGGAKVSFSEVSLELLPHDKITLFATANLGREVVPVSFTCSLGLYKRRRITYKNPVFNADAVPKKLHARSQALMDILVDILNRMVDLDRFNLDGVKLRLNRLHTEGKMLHFSGYAQIEHIPRKG